MTTPPIIEAQGDNYLCGRAYGAAAKDSIRWRLDNFVDDKEFAASTKEIRAALAVCEQYFPQYVREVNDAIRQATDGKRVLLLDAHALLSEADAYLAAPFIDGDFFVHVNHEAYSRLNERLRQLVREHPPPSRN